MTCPQTGKIRHAAQRLRALPLRNDVENLPSGILLGGQFTWGDYFLYNEIPTVIGNMVGGLTLVGAMIYATHYKTSPSRRVVGSAAE